MVRIKCTDDFEERRTVIKVMGLGGAGGNAVNRLAEAGIREVELVAANSDSQALRRNKAHVRIQLGENLTHGLGVGGDPAKGRAAALESQESIREALAGAQLVFVTAGMGGGTGTGGAPVVAQIAREVKSLVIGVVSRPFSFEGRIRAQIAENGIRELRSHADTLLIIPNDRIFEIIDAKTSHEEAFRKVDDVLRQAIQSISDVITTAGQVNVDFNDIQAVMAGAGEALMGVGEASGEDRAVMAAKRAVESPLLENVAIEGAKGMIVNVMSSSKVPLIEVKSAMEYIGRFVSPEANVKYGHAYDETLKEKVRITVIATGFPPRRGRPRFQSGPVRIGTLAPGGRAPRPPSSDSSPEDPSRPPGNGSSIPEEWSKPAFLRWKVRKIT